MADTADKVVKIKVIGVGGAGNNVINRMIASDVKGVEFVAVNTDKQDLEKSKCKNKVQIGEKLTGGMGAGSKPDIGQKSAEESKALISQVLEGTDMVFITAGMGGRYRNRRCADYCAGRARRGHLDCRRRDEALPL